MKICMTQTAPGSVDGIRVAVYLKDEEYDLSATDGERSLAAAFVGAGLAEEVKVEAKAVQSPAESQSAPENKADQPEEAAAPAALENEAAQPTAYKRTGKK